MNRWINDFLIALLICVATYIVAVPLIGVAAAMAIPVEYFEWFDEKGIKEMAFPTLSLFTTVPAQAIPALIISYILIRYASRMWLVTVVLSILFYLVYFYGDLYLLYSSYPNIIELNGYKILIPSLIFPVSIYLAGYLADKHTRGSIRDDTSSPA